MTEIPDAQRLSVLLRDRADYFNQYAGQSIEDFLRASAEKAAALESRLGSINATLTFYPCPRCGQNMIVQEVALPPSTTTGLTQTMRTATCRNCEPPALAATQEER